MKYNKMTFTAFLVILIVTPVFSQNVITPLFPLKDGFVAPDSSSGEGVELLADEELQASSWIVFKSSSQHYRNIRSAMLAIFIKSVRGPGLCGIHSLMKKIIGPEKMVSLSGVKFDDMPIAALQLDSSFSNQMILVNITEIVLSGAFYGIALRPMRGLSARFSSKEGFPPPAILVFRDTVNPETPKWWSSPELPDTSVGREGDFYVRAAQGVVFRKCSGVWDSVASFVIPPAPVLPPKKSTRTVSRKRRL